MSATIINSGEAIRSAPGVPAILLAGPGADWKDRLCEQLDNLPFEAIIYVAGKDRRWLIDAADASDTILFHNRESLLEEEDAVLVAMYAGSGKLMMNCHKTFWSHGSPSAVAAKAKCVSTFESMDALVSAVIERATDVASGEDVYDAIRDDKFAGGVPKKLFDGLKPFVNAHNAPAVAQTIREVFSEET